MNLLCQINKHQEFIDQFYFLKSKYHIFLHHRNELGNYKYTSLRSAFRSIKTNLPYRFAYTDFKGLNIPSTINHLEGLFGHLKEDKNTSWFG